MSSYTDVPVNSQGHNWDVLEYSGYTNAGKCISVVFTFDVLYCDVLMHIVPLSDPNMVINANQFIDKIKTVH